MQHLKKCFFLPKIFTYTFMFVCLFFHFFSWVLSQNSFIAKLIFFFLFGHTTQHVGSWVPHQGVESTVPAVEAQRPNAWSAREVLMQQFYICPLPFEPPSHLPPYPTPLCSNFKTLEYHFWTLLQSLHLFQPFSVKRFVSLGLLYVVALNSFPLPGAISDFFLDTCDILVYACLCSFLILIY